MAIVNPAPAVGYGGGQNNQDQRTAQIVQQLLQQYLGQQGGQSGGGVEGMGYTAPANAFPASPTGGALPLIEGAKGLNDLESITGQLQSGGGTRSQTPQGTTSAPSGQQAQSGGIQVVQQPNLSSFDAGTLGQGAPQEDQFNPQDVLNQFQQANDVANANPTNPFDRSLTVQPSQPGQNAVDISGQFTPSVLDNSVPYYLGAPTPAPSGGFDYTVPGGGQNYLTSPSATMWEQAGLFPGNMPNGYVAAPVDIQGNFDPSLIQNSQPNPQGGLDLNNVLGGASGALQGGMGIFNLLNAQDTGSQIAGAGQAASGLLQLGGAFGLPSTVGGVDLGGAVGGAGQLAGGIYGLTQGQDALGYGMGGLQTGLGAYQLANAIPGASNAIYGATGGLLGQQAAQTGAQAGEAALTGTAEGTTALSGYLGAAASWAPYIAAAVQLGYGVYGIAQNENLTNEQKAVAATGAAVSAAIMVAATVAGGVVGGLSGYAAGQIIQGGVDQILGEMADIPHDVREAIDIGRTNSVFNSTIPAIQSATTYDELAAALTPIFKGAYSEYGYPLVSGVSMKAYNMGAEGWRNLPDRGGLANLFASNDPNAIKFNWQQGITQEQRDQFGGALTALVRNQAGLIHAAQAGIPQASQLLTQSKQQYVADQARIKQQELAKQQAMVDSQALYGQSLEQGGDGSGAGAAW